jgi:hypothetical protein
MKSLRGPAGLVVAGFALSRVVYYAAGVRFDATPLRSFIQYVDPELLRHDLLESIWHLHTQPPLFNLLLGIVLKASGDAYDEVLNVIFVLAGLLLALGLYRLMVRLGVRPWPASALAVLFSASPPAVLYENWLYMDHFVALALVWAAVFVHRFVNSGRGGDALVAFGLLGAVVLSRTLFHLLFLVAAIALVALLQPGRRRTVAVAAALPVVLCLAVYVKTLVQFDTFGATTCSGINVARLTTHRVDPARRAELMRAGELSQFALTIPGDLPFKRPELFEREPVRGHPILDDPVKSTGYVNFDHAAYLDICRDYMDDAITLLKREPREARNGVLAATLIYWRPAGQYYFFSRPAERSRSRVWGIERVHAIGLGQARRPRVSLEESVAPRGAADKLLGVAWLVVAGYVLTAWWTARALLRERRSGTPRSPANVTCAFVVLTAAYVTLVGTFSELGENNRFRYLVDPLVFAAFAALAAEWLRQGRRRRR